MLLCVSLGKAGIIPIDQDRPIRVNTGVFQGQPTTEQKVMPTAPTFQSSTFPTQASIPQLWNVSMKVPLSISLATTPVIVTRYPSYVAVKHTCMPTSRLFCHAGMAGCYQETCGAYS